jgi:hypothetical protein
MRHCSDLHLVATYRRPSRAAASDDCDDHRKSRPWSSAGAVDPLGGRTAHALKRAAPHPTAPKLAEHAEVIRTLGKRAVRDIIEIGRRLVDAKKIAGHGNWLPWLEREFSWSSSTAGKYMNVYRMFQHRLSGKYVGATDLTIDIEALKTLAAPTTPDDVRDEAEQRADRGEHLSAADVQQMIDEARAMQEREPWSRTSCRSSGTPPIV